MLLVRRICFARSVLGSATLKDSALLGSRWPISRRAQERLKRKYSQMPQDQTDRELLRRRGSRKYPEESMLEMEWEHRYRNYLWDKMFPRHPKNELKYTHEQKIIEAIEEDIDFDRIIKLSAYKLLDSSVETLDEFIKNYKPYGIVLTPLQQDVINETRNLLSMMKSFEADIDNLISGTIYPKLTETQKTNLANHKKIFMTRRAQLTLTLYIIYNQHLSNFSQYYDRISKPLNKLSPNKYRLLSQGINLRMLYTIDLRYLQYLDQYKTSIKALLSEQANSMSLATVRYHLNNCHIAIFKIYCIADIYPNACTVPKDDLFSENRLYSKRWKRLNKITKLKVFGKHDEINQAFDVGRNAVSKLFAGGSHLYELMASGGLSGAHNLRSWIKGLVGDSFNILGYAWKQDKANRKADLFRYSPEKDALLKIFNADNNPLAKAGLSIVLPRISTVKVLYLDRHFPRITSELVQGWVREGNFGINPEPMQLTNTKIYNIDEYTKKLFVPGDEKDKVMVRLMSPNKLETFSPAGKSLLDVFGSNKPIRDIIFHVHGGGFICQNSFVHQMYTRLYSRELDVPLISIDYRLSPKWSYPYPLDDCFQAYLWVVHHFSQVFKNVDGTRPRVLVTGDSAGGNLITSITGLAIKLGLTIPDNVVMVYPALDLSPGAYSPSRLTSFYDSFISLEILRLCQQAYVQDPRDDADKDPFISPVLLSQYIIRKFPKTRIFVGNSDTMHDECLRMAYKLQTARKNVRLTVFDSFPHGFLQFDNPLKHMEYSRLAVSDIIASMRSMMKRRRR